MGEVGYTEKMWALGLGGFLSLAAVLRMEKRKLPVSPPVPRLLLLTPWSVSVSENSRDCGLGWHVGGKHGLKKVTQLIETVDALNYALEIVTPF